MKFDKFVEALFCMFFGAITMFIPVWLVVNCFIFVAGLSGNHCDKPKERIEYVFPGHIVGCWAQEPMEQDK